MSGDANLFKKKCLINFIAKYADLVTKPNKIILYWAQALDTNRIINVEAAGKVMWSCREFDGGFRADLQVASYWKMDLMHQND